MPKRIQLSIIIPVHNEQDWIALSMGRLDAAIRRADFEAEIIVIDDGSSDETLERIRNFKPTSKHLTIEVLSQDHKGRYLARKSGINKAKYSSILFIDSRVFIGEDALVYLGKKLKDDLNQVWNSHVYVAKKGNIFARFWDAIVCIVWRRYFGNPRETTYGLDDFDYFPKGTTMFFVPKKLFKEALADFESHSEAGHTSNDDTVLIRYLASQQPIHISPEFSCLYHGRSTFKKFLNHAHHRGQVFVDGFLKPGNRFFVPLLLFLAGTASIPFLLVLFPMLMVKLLLAGLAGGVCLLFLAAVALKVEWRDALSLAGLSPLFGVVYGAGIWRGVFRKLGIVK
jgi:glycosyltransferase involved in cell wall biosynthesis